MLVVVVSIAGVVVVAVSVVVVALVAYLEAKSVARCRKAETLPEPQPKLAASIETSLVCGCHCYWASKTEMRNRFLFLALHTSQYVCTTMEKTCWIKIKIFFHMTTTFERLTDCVGVLCCCCSCRCCSRCLSHCCYCCSCLLWFIFGIFCVFILLAKILALNLCLVSHSLAVSFYLSPSLSCLGLASRRHHFPFRFSSFSPSLAPFKWGKVSVVVVAFGLCSVFCCLLLLLLLFLLFLLLPLDIHFALLFKLVSLVRRSLLPPPPLLCNSNQAWKAASLCHQTIDHNWDSWHGPACPNRSSPPLSCF